MNRLWKRLTITLGILIALAAAAIAYDESPDGEMLRQWQNRPPVADENNLFFALAGADVDADEPLHAMGRRVFESPTPETIKRLTVSAQADFIGKYCRAITQKDAYFCLEAHLPEEKVPATDRTLAKRYLALRNYPAYRSEVRSDGVIPAVPFMKLHTAYWITQPFDTPQKMSVDELLASTFFLRDALAKSDQLVHRLVTAVVLERNIRIITELVELGTPSQAAALKIALTPLPPAALDVSRDIAFEYVGQRRNYQLLRKDLLAGGGTYLKSYIEALKSFDPSFALPESSWRLRLLGLMLKPEMSANAELRFMQGSVGIASLQPQNALQQSIKAALNLTHGAIRASVLDGPGLQVYRQRVTDLDYYIRLVGLVTARSGDHKTIDPAQAVADWNAKLAADDADYRLRWDDAQSAFVFDPKTDRWKGSAKEAGHGVQVRVPSYLVIEADRWRGYAARCSGNRCEILANGREPIVAAINARLPEKLQGVPEDVHQFPTIREIKPGQYVRITWIEQLNHGDWIERQVRLRVPAQ